MYARTIVLELVRREDEARRERGAALHERGANAAHNAEGGNGTTGANGTGGEAGTGGANGTGGTNGTGGETGADGGAEAAGAGLEHEHGDGSDAFAARVTSETLQCEGSTFDWWVIGEQPAFVTISSPKLGKLNGFTDSDPEVFAMGLARQLLRGLGASAAQTDEAAESDRASQCPLTKPGWFEK